MRPIVLAAVAASVVAVARPLAAQDLRVGDRVRVQARFPYGSATGRVVALDRRTVRVVQDGTTAIFVIPRNQIVRLDVGRGRSTSAGALHGLVLGAGAGALGGLAIGAAAKNAGPGALYGAAGGAVVGAILGARHPGSHWSHLAGDGRVAVAPTPRGVTLALRF